MSANIYLIISIAVIACVTVFTRALPFVLFGKKDLPPAVKYLADALPPGIMVILVCYCLRNIDIIKAPHALPELLACVAVSISWFIKKNLYVSIIIGTVCYMLLLRVL